MCTYVCVLVSTWPHIRSCLGPLSSLKMLFSHIINCVPSNKSQSTQKVCVYWTLKTRHFHLLCGLSRQDSVDRWQDTGWERGALTFSMGPQFGFEPPVAAVRTQPVLMGRTLHKLSYWSVQDKPLLKLPNPASLMVNTLTNYIVFWNNFKRSLLRLFLKIYQRMNLWIYNPTLDMLMWIISLKKNIT